MRSVRKGSIWSENSTGKHVCIGLSVKAYEATSTRPENRFLGGWEVHHTHKAFLMYEDEFREKYSWVRGK